MRFNPLAQSVEPLAPPTLEPSQHYLFDSKPGDISATMIGGAVGTNLFILAIETKKGVADSLAKTIPGAEVERWSPAGSSDPRWTVYVRNVSVGAALRFLDLVHAGKRSNESKMRQPDAKRKTQPAQRSASHATQHVTITQGAASETTAERVRKTNASTFGFLLGDGCDAPLAKRARESFAAYCEAQKMRGDWRRPWADWPGRASFEARAIGTPRGPVNIVVLAAPETSEADAPSNIIPMPPPPRPSAAVFIGNLRAVAF